MSLTEETARKYLPEKIQNIGLGLLGLGFTLHYSYRKEEPGPGRRIPARGHLTARKEGIRLKVVITWMGPDRKPEVCLYEVESVKGNRPSLSRRGSKTFWKAAKGAGG